MPYFIIGCDLGQAKDYTAISIIERVMGDLPEGYREDENGQVFQWDHFEGRLPTTDPRRAAYHVRHLERPALKTKYPEIVARVKEIQTTAPLTAETPLIVDRTGVGIAVADIFTEAGMRPICVTITGGNEITASDPYDIRVPKRELVGNLVLLVQSGRLKVSDGLTEGATFINELLNFKLKINIATGHDTYEAWRENIHDDLVLSVAMACWHGERFPPGWNRVTYAPLHLYE